MRTEKRHATALLAAAAAAVALVAAPAVTAAPSSLKKFCVVASTGTTCPSPGNVEVKSPVPVVDIQPY
ncbi:MULTISPECIES: hypothetical protein [unclassified Mycobacterium]|uniref:hypothetical protein n=1 Tax=unclassified Mycobacterium TaxID=2642494 RepID=UPI0029C823EE|nr:MULTISPECIES: hypothetical protein [unclassified Mycobacterium]